jgi:hypothetical protein
MPLFHLKLRGPEVPSYDDDPQEFADLEAARLEAIESLRELASHAILEGRAFDHIGIEISDERGLKLAEVHSAEAIPQLVPSSAKPKSSS